MKKNLLIASALVLVSASAFAADAGTTTTAAPAPAAKKSGVRGELLFWIRDAETKLTQLAEATPENKFKWKPSKDSRTTAEVFMHVAGANYGIPSFFGVKPPEGYNHETYEKTLTKKADVIKAMKDSFAHALNAFEKLPDADLEKEVELFGFKSTIRGVYMLILAHSHEHLGQSIVHARSNGIAPPWTAKMKEAAEKLKSAEMKK